MKTRWLTIFCALLMLASPVALAGDWVAERDMIDCKEARGTLTLYAEPYDEAKVLGKLVDGQIFAFETSVDEEGWLKVSTWDAGADKLRIGWIHDGHYRSIGDGNPSDRAHGEVISLSAAIRVGPSGDAKKLATMNNGEVFTLARDDGDYLFVHYEGGNSGKSSEGYIRADLVVYGAKHITCNSSNTPAYAYPSLRSHKVGLLSAGTRLTVIEELDDFWVVSLRNAAASIPKGADLHVE